MNLINAIGSVFKKFSQGWTFGTPTKTVTVKDNTIIQVDILGDIDVEYDYRFQKKSGTLAHLDDIPEFIGGQVPIRQVFSYSSSNVFSLANPDPTAIYVALNGQVLEEGSIYDWTISGTQLTVTTPLEAGDEISILYYTDLPSVTLASRNIDGGAPDTVYLPIQNVDGGTP